VRGETRLDAVDRPLVVAVGRVTPEKGTHVLAEASAICATAGATSSSRSQARSVPAISGPVPRVTRCGARSSA
jgi:hypothetical protein